MKRIIIIGEGQTEQEFCNDILLPYFANHDIYITNPTIKKSNGGIVAWRDLKKEIEIYLKQDSSTYVTLLIDYYGLYSNMGYPYWDESLNIVDIYERMDFLEKAMLNDIDDNLKNRFIPYIQVHEFEGILFSNKEIFDNNFDEDEFLDHDYLEETVSLFENPEMINNGRDTAPSKRLKRILKDYNKIVHGSLLAAEIGLSNIMDKCPRFNSWIHMLLEK